MKKELLKGLTKEQIAKVRTCKNSDDLLALAKAEGIELTDEQLSAVNGGCKSVSSILSYMSFWDCPECGCNDIVKDGREYTCQGCGHKWMSN